MRGVVRVYALILNGPPLPLPPAWLVSFRGVSPAPGRRSCSSGAPVRGFVPAAQAISAADGSFAFSQRPSAPAAYRARAGTALSPVVRVAVKPSVAVAASGRRVQFRPRRPGREAPSCSSSTTASCSAGSRSRRHAGRALAGRARRAATRGPHAGRRARPRRLGRRSQPHARAGLASARQDAPLHAACPGGVRRTNGRASRWRSAAGKKPIIHSGNGSGFDASRRCALLTQWTVPLRASNSPNCLKRELLQHCHQVSSSAPSSNETGS